MHGISYAALLLIIDGLPSIDDGKQARTTKGKGKPLTPEELQSFGLPKGMNARNS